jgi:hypothetical protein
MALEPMAQAAHGHRPYLVQQAVVGLVGVAVFLKERHRLVQLPLEVMEAYTVVVVVVVGHRRVADLVAGAAEHWPILTITQYPQVVLYRW